jgi:penicillin amidase
MDIYLLTVIVIGLVGAVVLAFLALLWAIFRRPLPQVKGELHIDGLDAAVEVVRDHWGVPHIYADSEHDAWFAQGYVHAQDRLFQMEYTRRLARGAMAEAFGAVALEADRWSRVLGFWRATLGDLEQLSADDRAVLEAYAAGVNACVEARRYRLPAEFTIMGLKPELWQPEDTLGVLKVLAWALSQNWEGEILRLQLLHALGPERAVELDPFYPAGSPVITPAEGQVSPQALADATSRLLAAYRQAGQWFGHAATAGSNNWVISPGRTATRRPLLANDPHLTVSMPTLWYQNHLHVQGGSLQVSGATIPGLPGVVTGHNAHVAWGITAGRADTQDLYVEQRHPEQPTWFRFEDEWEGAQVYREEIRVRGQAEPYVEEVLVTRHGPLVNSLLPTGHLANTPEGQPGLPPLALRWGGHYPSTSLRGLLALQKVSDWSSFRAALSLVTDPSLNMVYADVEGNIGYQYVARVPRRRSSYGLLPTPGWSEAGEWDGWLPFEELPHAFNPPQGYALSANNKPAPDDYPHFLGADWYPGYRAVRIERMLQAKPRYTVRDFQNMQTDVYSVQAESLQPYMIMADPFGTVPRGAGLLEQRIVRELETWNLLVEVDSFPAAAYEVMRIHLLDLVFGDKLGQLSPNFKGISFSDIFAASAFSGKASLALANLLKQEQSWWYHDATTNQPRTRQEVLDLALKQTATSLHQMIGQDPRKWAWGKVHQVEFAHLFGRSGLMRTLFNRGQYPIGGDEETVWMTAGDLQLPFGLVRTSATYRQVLDVGDWDRSTAVLSTGQSGQPTGPHYADMIDLWREGEQHPMLWTRSAVDAEAVTTLWLRPRLEKTR